jgi:hypothetical protein
MAKTLSSSTTTTAKTREKQRSTLPPCISGSIGPTLRAKEKPFLERFIGTFQKECLDYHYELMNAPELTVLTNNWLEKYHFYRPHESLGSLTPAEFSAKLGISIPHTGSVL